MKVAMIGTSDVLVRRLLAACCRATAAEGLEAVSVAQQHM
jgi:hypothetical protein